MVIHRQDRKQVHLWKLTRCRNEETGTKPQEENIRIAVHETLGIVTILKCTHLKQYSLKTSRCNSQSNSCETIKASRDRHTDIVYPRHTHWKHIYESSRTAFRKL